MTWLKKDCPSRVSKLKPSALGIKLRTCLLSLISAPLAVMYFVNGWAIIFDKSNFGSKKSLFFLPLLHPFLEKLSFKAFRKMLVLAIAMGVLRAARHKGSHNIVIKCLVC